MGIILCGPPDFSGSVKYGFPLFITQKFKQGLSSIDHRLQSLGALAIERLKSLDQLRCRGVTVRGFLDISIDAGFDVGPRSRSPAAAILPRSLTAWTPCR